MIFFILTSFILNSSEIIIYSGKKEIDSKKLAELIQKSDVVYVGETHTSEFSHYIQLEVLKIMTEKKGNKICVGFEMLNRTLQPYLDDYILEKINEEDFLKSVNWEKEWGFDFSLYRALFEFIRDKKLKALAVNVPRKIVGKVAREGLKSLNEEEKKLTAKKIRINKDKKYNIYLKETFSGHGPNPMNTMFSFENYQASMAVWNESMAELAADFMKNNPGYSFVFFAGNGHIIYNAAIPWSFKKRIKGLKHLSIYTASEDEIILSKDFYKWADIIIVKKKEINQQ